MIEESSYTKDFCNLFSVPPLPFSSLPRAVCYVLCPRCLSFRALACRFLVTPHAVPRGRADTSSRHELPLHPRPLPGVYSMSLRRRARIPWVVELSPRDNIGISRLDHAVFRARSFFSRHTSSPFWSSLFGEKEKLGMDHEHGRAQGIHGYIGTREGIPSPPPFGLSTQTPHAYVCATRRHAKLLDGPDSDHEEGTRDRLGRISFQDAQWITYVGTWNS